MWRDFLLREFGHMLGSFGDGTMHDVDGTEAGQPSSAGADEYRHMLVPSNTALAQQAVDCCSNVAGQADRTLLATFTSKHNLRARFAQRQVGCLNAESLRDPGPRSCEG